MSDNSRICPFCHEAYDAAWAPFRCDNPQCADLRDDLLTRFWGEETVAKRSFVAERGWLQRLTGAIPSSARCQCGAETFIRLCPHCHNVIPLELLKKRSYTISIIGARGSGKTNYITVLIHQMSKYAHRLGDLSFEPVEAGNDPEKRTSTHYKRNFEDVLFVSGKLASQTQIGGRESRIPLIYRLMAPGGKTINFVFYDTAGENFNDLTRVKANVKQLAASDATLFLLDTLQVREVKRRLGLPDDPQDLPFNAILSTIKNHFFSDNQRAEREAHQRRPMALVFSKIDAVLTRTDKFEDSLPDMTIDNNSPYLQDKLGVSLRDMDSVHGQMAGALETWGEGQFLADINNFYHNYKYFGVSALGQMPDQYNEIDPERIRPYRVMDPVVWILHQLRFPLKERS